MGTALSVIIPEGIHAMSMGQKSKLDQILLTLCFRSGPCCSKLTASLVNISLEFQMLISDIRRYFLLKKCKELLQCKSFSHFLNKKISVFGYKVVNHLTS